MIDGVYLIFMPQNKCAIAWSYATGTRCNVHCNGVETIEHDCAVSCDGPGRRGADPGLGTGYGKPLIHMLPAING